MPSYRPNDFFKKCKLVIHRQNTSTRDCVSHDRSIATGIRTVSGPVLACGSFWSILPAPISQESTSAAAAYRNTSDAAQTYLPPVQAVAGAVPGVGGIIKGVIGGILSILELIDRRIQNKGDLESLRLLMLQLRNSIDNAPTARTASQEAMRRQLLSALRAAKSKLEGMENRTRGAASVTRDIAGCILRINNNLLQFLVFSQMYLENDVSETKDQVSEIKDQLQIIVSSIATARLPADVSLGHVILVDATGREHPLRLDQCLSFDQLDAMLRASLFQCRPDEAEIQRWYINRKLYDFVIYGGTDSSVMQLTRNSDIWTKIDSGTRIVMRAINEVAEQRVTARYKCPCGASATINVTAGDLGEALRHGCTIMCQHCNRRFEVKREFRTQRHTGSTDGHETGTGPMAEAKYLIRNFLLKQTLVRVK